VVLIVNDDMPFLLASISGELHRQKRRIQRILHPVFRVRRSAKGRFLAFDPEGEPESWMHIEIDSDGGRRGIAKLEKELREVLEEVRVSIDDWQAMRNQALEIAEGLTTAKLPVKKEERSEARQLLLWLLDNHYTFLGFRRYVYERGEKSYLRMVPNSGLGLLRRETEESLLRGQTPLSPILVDLLDQERLLTITKSSRRSRVHRSVHMDAIGVRRFDSKGRVIGEDRFVGLFTSSVYSTPATEIPVLRLKTQRLMERSGFSPSSHDGKALAHIIESFPRDEFFQIDKEEFLRMALGIMQLEQRPRLALFVRHDDFGRFVSSLVYVPRERFTFALREKIQRRLESAFGGKVTAFYTQMADTPLARVHYIVKTTPGEVPEVDLRQLEATLARDARTWSEHLREHMIARHGEEEGLALARSFTDSFPPSYREFYPAKAAVPDISILEEFTEGDGNLEVRLYRPPGIGGDGMRLKLYRCDRHLALSEALPILENLGVRVESEVPFRVRGCQGRSIWIHDFELRSPDGSEIPYREIKSDFEETVRRVWSGEFEDGGLNRLILRGGLDWRQITVLRAYSRYLRQAGVRFSQRYMATTLFEHADISRLLWRLFEVLFDPAERRDFRSRAAGVMGEIRQALEGVASLDEDRILRAFLTAIKGTLRTNYFQRSESGEPKPYLSIKLDSRSIRLLPEPRPKVEIFVYSPRMEGVHLRGGDVARGGIRWSDRREDFRTEILGLLKAQMVKNAVIVPVGAKGGFVVSRPPTTGGREAFIAEGIECYKTLIRGLLDLTDNLVGDEVVPAPDVVRRDGDDTYLVVAADKGTATFSDIANQISADYGFWLGDAFASGGSAGYDHKKMGITARGAWEAVKRHFREIGTDIQNQPFSVVGVGDMSGDVFGNGMLLSEQTRLLGAFNHLHIFVDPNPDPRRSFAERQRLFALPRSSWSEYDSKALSAGGRVFERSAKSVSLSPEIQEALGIERRKITPNELIQILLSSPVDLLFFGGIGSFVKASQERHADAGDRANDALRVDADKLRCRVVGEGANLGMTQAARVQYALAGGRVNTDAIDNSGGVDCSDHEVNIKIALGPAVAGGDLDVGSRNDLLVQMTEEVASLVLRHNYLQTQAISLAQARAVVLMDHHARMLRSLERSGRLDRALEGLPNDEELTERAAAGRGLTRPELAVLLAYSKIALYEELLASDVPDAPRLAHDLERYFPRPLRETFSTQVGSHRLRREIIATYVTNSMVNRVGPSFVFRLGEAAGASAPDVARAYAITRGAFDLRKTWAAIEALDNVVSAEMQTRLFLETARLTERVTLWFLHQFEGHLDVDKLVDGFRPPLRRLAKSLESVLSAGARREMRRRARGFQRQGVPEALAERIAALQGLTAGTDIVRLAEPSELDVEHVARVYFTLGERFGFDWLRKVAGRVRVESSWQRAALDAFLGDLDLDQSRMTRQVLDSGAEASWRRAINNWSKQRTNHIDRLHRLLEELKGLPKVDLAMLSVAEHQIQNLLDA
jgi:glutamate dehydrogenase